MVTSRLSARLPRLRESMWFVPGLMVLAAIGLAEAVVAIDRAIGADETGALGMGAEGSRGILVAVAGSALAVAATMFSITMSVIATASSTYGPRLVRNFMSDRSNQQVLGLFVATFVYGLMVLRTVRDGSNGAEAFVPHVAVYVAIGLALACVGGLIYFLHHIADVIQVATLVRRVRVELEQVAETLYGEDAHTDRMAVDALPDSAATVTADRAGFVTTVDGCALVDAAREVDVRIDLLAIPGTHVLVGEPLASWQGRSSASDAVADAVRRHVHVGDVRTPDQDIHVALQQMVEMAVRAVSPSMNDPYTARNAIDELACGLVPAMREPAPPPGWLDEDGRVRLRWAPPSGADLVDTVFDDVRTYAASDPLVVRAALRLAGRIRSVASDGTRARLDRQLDELLAASERSGLPDFDLERLRSDRARLEASGDAGISGGEPAGP